MAEVQHYEDNLERLTDYVWMTLSRLSSVPITHLAPSERKLLGYIRKTGDLGPVVVEALLLMAEDLYEGQPAGEKPSTGDGRPRALDHEEALKLVKAAGRKGRPASLRLAALRSEELIGRNVSKSALARALGTSYGKAA